MVKTHAAPDQYQCCLCGDIFPGYGNNPWPLAEYPQRCCADCNAMRVIPARLFGLPATGDR